MAFPGGPGGFRELREAYRNDFHLSWYLVVPEITSYGLNLQKDLKTNLINDAFPKKNLVMAQKLSMFEHKFGFYIKFYSDVQILRSTGLRGGQNINKWIL